MDAESLAQEVMKTNMVSRIPSSVLKASD